MNLFLYNYKIFIIRLKIFINFPEIFALPEIARQILVRCHHTCARAHNLMLDLIELKPSTQRQSASCEGTTSQEDQNHHQQSLHLGGVVGLWGCESCDQGRYVFGKLSRYLCTNIGASLTRICGGMVQDRTNLISVWCNVYCNSRN